MAIRTLLITVRRNPKLTTALIVRGLPGEKGDKGDQGDPGEGVSSYADIEALVDYPETFPPESHTHPVEQVTGVLPVEKGGTGATSASAARTALGSGTVGDQVFQAATVAAALAALKMQTVAPSGDFSVTSSTTPQNIIGMSFQAEANTTYAILLFAHIDCGSGGFRIITDFPSAATSATGNGFGFRIQGDGSVPGVSTWTAETNLNTNARAAAQTGPATSFYMFRTGATAGTVNFQFAQVSSNATASTILGISRAFVISL